MTQDQLDTLRIRALGCGYLYLIRFPHMHGHLLAHRLAKT